MARLEHKTALVTGGARGIGAAISELFVQEGANVVITDILETEGQELADRLGRKATFIRHDVRQEADWKQATDKLVSLHGRIDILVNNAGLLTFKALPDLSIEEMRQQIEVNLIGTMIGRNWRAP